MRRVWLSAVGVLVVACGMAYGGTGTMTVQDLRGILAEMQANHKDDQEVANRLKLVKLSEPLTPEVMNTFVAYQPGPLTIVQLQVLSLETALMAPPAEELPKAAAPDIATQGAMLKLMVTYITKQYAQVPRLTADKKMARYQNGSQVFHAGSGQKSQMSNANSDVLPPDPFFRFLGEKKFAVPVQGGFELPGKKVSADKFAELNLQPAPDGMVPNLGMVLGDAARGKLAWERWQTIEGKQVAVFAYAVPRGISHYDVQYCCFPVMEMHGMVSAGVSAAGVVTSYEEFRSTPGYHGELFVDPATGVVVRLILEADFKPSDPVLNEDTRIDYAPVSLGMAQYVAPAMQVRQTTLIPFGESLLAVLKQMTLEKAEYSNYR
jgi:hypothetical protein